MGTYMCAHYCFDNYLDSLETTALLQKIEFTFKPEIVLEALLLIHGPQFIIHTLAEIKNQMSQCSVQGHEDHSRPHVSPTTTRVTVYLWQCSTTHAEVHGQNHGRTTYQSTDPDNDDETFIILIVQSPEYETLHLLFSALLQDSYHKPIVLSPAPKFTEGQSPSKTEPVSQYHSILGTSNTKASQVTTANNRAPPLTFSVE